MQTADEADEPDEAMRGSARPARLVQNTMLTFDLKQKILNYSLKIFRLRKLCEQPTKLMNLKMLRELRVRANMN